jgi:hypothetical protein
MADRLYRWLWNWWIPRGYSKTHGSKCLGWFKAQSEYAFATWKKNNQSVRQQPFYSIAEVYNYNISAGKSFDFGDKKVNYFENGFNSMINFEFKYDKKDYEFIFSKYYSILKEILFWTIYLLMMTVVPLTLNEPKLLKQVQNFYFLRDCSILWWWKRPFSSSEGTQETPPYVRLWTGMLLLKILKQKNTVALEKTRPIS